MKAFKTSPFFMYIVGIVILSLGISFTIHSELGTSPFDALLVGLSNNVGLTVGSWEIIMAFLLIICNSVLTKQRVELFGLLTAFIAGISIDLWLLILEASIPPDHLAVQFFCFFFGLILSGLGTALYLLSNYAPIPIDRLTLIVKDITKTNLFFSRTVIYILFLVLAVLFKGTIGVGTILTVCFGGVILNYFNKMIRRFYSGTNSLGHSV
ncbi:YitT family protein [Neobacillus mesonae]|nr:YitT family protein [Neobacillus mesonae]